MIAAGVALLGLLGCEARTLDGGWRIETDPPLLDGLAMHVSGFRFFVGGAAGYRMGAHAVADRVKGGFSGNHLYIQLEHGNYLFLGAREGTADVFTGQVHLPALPASAPVATFRMVRD